MIDRKALVKKIIRTKLVKSAVIFGPLVRVWASPDTTFFRTIGNGPNPTYNVIKIRLIC